MGPWTAKLLITNPNPDLDPNLGHSPNPDHNPSPDHNANADFDPKPRYRPIMVLTCSDTDTG